MHIKNIYVYPRYPESLQKLFQLAFNVWSLWDEEMVQLFDRIDGTLFRKSDLNPVQFLYSVPEERLIDISKDSTFLKNVEETWKRYDTYALKKTMYGERFRDKKIAYFSMEYGLHSSIPIYAGGLGILSGDHLKGASDLGIPIIGIGLLYRYGYFNQRINIHGMQEEEYIENSVFNLPLKELKSTDGEPVYVTVEILGTPVMIKVWLIHVGRAHLVLLDTNIEANAPDLRRISNYLYDAGRDVRMQQELVLGLGGMEALDAMNIKPDVYHLNEGHSAFLIVQRLKKLVVDEGMPFDEAYALIKNTTIFTTHTPVEAGNENFPAEMVEKYLSKKVEELGVPLERILEYGTLHDKKTFWLPAFAMRFSRYVNAVSRLHGKVSRGMWRDLFPGEAECEVPITYITNGVHYSWISPAIKELFNRYIPRENYAFSEDETALRRVLDIPDEEIWEAHLSSKRKLIGIVRMIMEASYSQKGFALSGSGDASALLDERYLTIGFARRFAAYKRPTLIMQDKERLKRILLNEERPVQIIFTGKAHPADSNGKNMIKEVVDFARDQELQNRSVFVENYNMNVARALVQGVDIWLNTPLRPYEASGTSGMKAGMNGVLNLSILDGWWPESYNKKNGWAIRSGRLDDSLEARNTIESRQIYTLLEKEITRLYYDRDASDIPHEWVKMMKESIYTIVRDFNITRTLREYSEKFYLPAIEARRKITGDEKYLAGVLKNAAKMQSVWNKVYIKDVFMNIDKREVLFTDDTIKTQCYVFLDDAGPGIFNVEFFYFFEKDGAYETVTLDFIEKYPDKTAKYEGVITLKYSGIQSIGVRLVPADEEVRALYPERIKWYDIS